MEGIVTYRFNLYNSSVTNLNNICFQNTIQNFPRGGYTLWNCVKPNPIGRSVILFLREKTVLQIHEFIVFGTEIMEINYRKIFISRITSTSLSISTPANQYKYILGKTIDGRINNVIGEGISCVGVNKNLKSITFHFHYQSVIYFIGIFTIRQSNSFNNVDIQIISITGNQTNILNSGNVNTTNQDYLMFNLSTPFMGKGLHLFGSEMKVCEIFLYGYNFDNQTQSKYLNYIIN